MYKEIKDQQKYVEAVAAYSYDDFLLGIPIEKILIPNKYKLIVLDRYTMYNGAGAELIPLCGKNSVILIDCKGVPEFKGFYYWCAIEMTENSLDVVD